MTSPRLQNVQALATIFAAIAVPVVVSLIGWQIQTSISKQSVRSAYVQIAAEVLSNAKSTDDKELRQWAVTLLDQNSPVPFTSSVRTGLVQGTIVIQTDVFRPMLATPMMSPPQPWVAPPKDFSLDQLMANYKENMQRAQHNYLGLKYLQKAIRAEAEIESRYYQPTPAPATSR